MAGQVKNPKDWVPKTLTGCFMYVLPYKFKTRDHSLDWIRYCPMLIQRRLTTLLAKSINIINSKIDIIKSTLEKKEADVWSA